MRLSVWAGFTALFFSVTATAGLQELAAVMPPCALECFGPALSASGCALTNQTCICTNPVLTATLEKCVVGSCTIRESLTTKNVTSQACHAPIRDRTGAVSIPALVGGILAFIAFILRIIARTPWFGGKFGWDDYTMGLTIMLSIALTALSPVLADYGLGRDMWTLPFHNITMILYFYFWDELIYLSILPMTKISICCFYLRVFPQRGFRTITYIVIALNVGYLISFVLISVFQCTPLHGAWEHWDGSGNFRCNNINAQGWCAAILNMLLDIIVMLLPLRELYRLNLSMRKKLYVMCMFSLGIFVTLVSILRLESMIHFASTQNLTWDYTAIGYWSTIECHVGIICACLPAIRALMRRVSPGVFGDTAVGTAPSKRSGSRSVTMGSRLETLEGKVSVRVKGGHSDFVPLNNLDNSSQVHLTNHSA
ncbi:hypothetical protein FE257_012338 [Aspergillus nanangensis]|uniref:CFEM domain-containing protein n=1 Tax=Aspergillus nanangensis TaxID=2582783 RepID=A0AAD4CFV4_ASPNN|nr:hypothetical protein FE257_012338 [Aspergillus nanangensis]